MKRIRIAAVLAAACSTTGPAGPPGVTPDQLATLQLMASCANPSACSLDLGGPLGAAASGYVTVGTTTVAVNAATILRRGTSLRTLADFNLGDPVHVSGYPDASGSPVAVIFEVVEESGTLTSISGFTFTMGPQTFQTDANTTYSGVGSPKSLADLKVGDRLVVTVRQPVVAGAQVAAAVVRL